MTGVKTKMKDTRRSRGKANQATCREGRLKHLPCGVTLHPRKAVGPLHFSPGSFPSSSNLLMLWSRPSPWLSPLLRGTLKIKISITHLGRSQCSLLFLELSYIPIQVLRLWTKERINCQWQTKSPASNPTSVWLAYRDDRRGGARIQLLYVCRYHELHS